MREGRELIGWGMATGVWEAHDAADHRAGRAHDADGKLEVATATADIGTGTYTILAQIAADALGVPIERCDGQDRRLVAAEIARRGWLVGGRLGRLGGAGRLPQAARTSCSSTPAGRSLAPRQCQRSTGSSSQMAASRSPANPARGRDARARRMKARGATNLTAEETAAPDPETKKKYARYTHSAIFAEVRVDEDLGVVRVTRIVNAVAAGKILNLEDRAQPDPGRRGVRASAWRWRKRALIDHQLGRFMNHNIAEYHIPVNADIHDIDVIFVEEHDDQLSPIGIKGLGEIGIVGTAAAIANAIFHATGKRIRDLPITIDKVMGAGETKATGQAAE